MAARRRPSGASGTSFFNKDLFIFIIIIAIVAYVTYILTYSAITAKIDEQLGVEKSSGSYQLLPPAN